MGCPLIYSRPPIIRGEGAIIYQECLLVDQTIAVMLLGMKPSDSSTQNEIGQLNKCIPENG